MSSTAISATFCFWCCDVDALIHWLFLRFPIPENEVYFDDYNDLDGAGRIGLTYGEIYKYRVLDQNFFGPLNFGT